MNKLTFTVKYFKKNTYFNPFLADVLILYPFKPPGFLGFSEVHRMGTLA